jgi:hypothetical protein
MKYLPLYIMNRKQKISAGEKALTNNDHPVLASEILQIMFDEISIISYIMP